MTTNKIALITGITGQDGSYLAEFLLNMDYEVHGVKRQTSTSSDGRLKHILNNITLHDGDMTDLSSLLKIINVVRPMEIYNLAAQSHVQVSFSSPLCTAKINGLGALNLLEAVRISNIASTCRIYQASTSEMFGRVVEVPQSEHTPFYPRSPYGVSKVMAYWGVVNYREAYNLFACNGILFNHESPRRGDNFVTRKITKAVAAIKRGIQDILYLGNLDAERDWGHARDYVECMWLMLQQPTPEDFVIATGETTTVREFVRKAFKCIGINIVFRGEGDNEVGIDLETEKALVRVSDKYKRPSEVHQLIGDPTKAITQLKWNPRKTSLDELTREMVESDLDAYNI